MPVTCIVFGCKSRYKRHNVTFHSIPIELNHRHKTYLNDLSRERRAKWLAAIKREDLTESKMRNQKVCSKHFINGKF